MEENTRLDEIKKRLQTNAYFINPASDANAADDLKYLLAFAEEQQRKAEQLQKKNEVLSNHALELTQEMENIKSDFGNSR